MKYRIKKHKTCTITVGYDAKGNKHPCLTRREWYQASRKGKFLGFWHAIGYEYDFDGSLSCYQAQTLEDIEEFIKIFHEANYGNDVKYEVIKEINL